MKEKRKSLQLWLRGEEVAAVSRRAVLVGASLAHYVRRLIHADLAESGDPAADLFAATPTVGRPRTRKSVES